MLKRFTCMILSLVLLMGLIPAAAITASAASNATSDKAITILKKLESFSSTCDDDGYTGYGTKCTETGEHGQTGDDAHIIRESEASADLKKAMEAIDTELNSFASKKGISLSQNQHDALAIFSFENGTVWTKGADDLQTAVVNGTTGQAFVDIMRNWKSTDSNDRRDVESNMYLNNAYNSDASALKITTAEKYDPEDLVNDSRVKVTVTNDFINVRAKASLYGAKVGTVYKGDVLRITATTEANNYLWGRYVDENYEKVGYVALMYTNYDELIAADKAEKDQAAANTPVVMGSATVDVNGYVNVRSGAGTHNPIISSLRDGTKVDLYAIQYVNGKPWGKTNVGWFSLAYAPGYTVKNSANDNKNDYGYLNYQFTEKSDNKVFSGKDAVSETEIKSATFTTITEVTVRDSASVGGSRVNTLAKGTEFDVTKVKADDNTVWGYAENLEDEDDKKYDGWIDLSTKNVTRNGVTLKDETNASEACKIATVINCVEVNMRKKANIYGDKVGTLPVGTVVKVLEGPVNGTKKTGWYRLDVKPTKGTDAWVRGDYLDVRNGTVGEITYGKTSSSVSGSQSGIGKGMVANTYGGVNVRTAPGTANAKVTKLLPGTIVDILSTTMYGSTKWGRIEQGWVCMDYIAMMDYDNLDGTNTTITSTQVVYEGSVNGSQKVYKEPDRSANPEVVRDLGDGEAVTIHELLTVSEVTYDDGTTTHTTKTHWARVNDGYIPEPEQNISLDALYEQVYTVTGTDLLKVREWPSTEAGREDMDLNKGDQVKITNLQIVDNQIWGMFEHDDLGNDGVGWICLSYCTKGAIASSDQESGDPAIPAPSTPVTMSSGNIGKNTYSGKIIGSAQVQEVNVRKEPSSNSEKVTDLKKGTAITITETRLVDGRSWGYCGSGWINLLYVDLTPVGTNAIDAKVIAVDNTLVYESSETGAKVVGSYANRAVVHIYSEMNGMYETDMGWISKGNCL